MEKIIRLSGLTEANVPALIQLQKTINRSGELVDTKEGEIYQAEKASKTFYDKYFNASLPKGNTDAIRLAQTYFEQEDGKPGLTKSNLRQFEKESKLYSLDNLALAFQEGRSFIESLEDKSPVKIGLKGILKSRLIEFMQELQALPLDKGLLKTNTFQQAVYLMNCGILTNSDRIAIIDVLPASLLSENQWLSEALSPKKQLHQVGLSVAKSYSTSVSSSRLQATKMPELQATFKRIALSSEYDIEAKLGFIEGFRDYPSLDHSSEKIFTQEKFIELAQNEQFPIALFYAAASGKRTLVTLDFTKELEIIHSELTDRQKGLNVFDALDSLLDNKSLLKGADPELLDAVEEVVTQSLAGNNKNKLLAKVKVLKARNKILEKHQSLDTSLTKSFFEAIELNTENGTLEEFTKESGIFNTLIEEFEEFEALKSTEKQELRKQTTSLGKRIDVLATWDAKVSQTIKDRLGKTKKYKARSEQQLTKLENYLGTLRDALVTKDKPIEAGKKLLTDILFSIQEHGSNKSDLLSTIIEKFSKESSSLSLCIEQIALIQTLTADSTLFTLSKANKKALANHVKSTIKNGFSSLNEASNIDEFKQNIRTVMESFKTLTGKDFPMSLVKKMALDAINDAATAAETNNTRSAEKAAKIEAAFKEISGESTLPQRTPSCGFTTKEQKQESKTKENLKLLKERLVKDSEKTVDSVEQARKTELLEFLTALAIPIELAGEFRDTADTAAGDDKLEAARKLENGITVNTTSKSLSAEDRDALRRTGNQLGDKVYKVLELIKDKDLLPLTESEKETISEKSDKATAALAELEATFPELEQLANQNRQQKRESQRI